MPIRSTTAQPLAATHLRSPLRSALRIALAYALLASLWIILSDRAMDLVASSPAQLSQLQTYKGSLFVVVTALFLFSLVLHTLSELHQAYRQTQDSQALYQSLVDALPQCLYRIDREGRLIFANNAALKFAGLSLQDALGKTVYDFFPEAYGNDSQEEDRRVLAGETLDLIKETITPATGKKGFIAIVKTPLLAADGCIVGVQGIFWDITERKDAEATIEYLANHDHLTGLPNRLLLCDRFNQAAIQAKQEELSVGMLFIDIDHLKDVNDTLGHPVGDRLLQEVADRLRQAVHQTDTISRYGGDAFVIISPSMRSHLDATRIAERLLAAIDEPLCIDNTQLQISFSIGIAVYPDNGQDFDSLLQAAESAMYQVKAAGRNGYRHYAKPSNEGLRERLDIQRRLQPAFRAGKLQLFYQPQFDLDSGALVGAEALLRWHDEELGWISPAQFIPIAEDTGLIVPIGAWVIDEACRQLRVWRDAGLPPLTLAVNLSPVQFRRDDPVATVAAALQRHAIEGAALEIELTESMLVHDNDSADRILNGFKTLGVGLAIDDFGTGYSNLGYLQHFAFDKLKIDQSFVRNMQEHPESTAIVRSIITIAENLKLNTLAEGVETKEQAEALRRFGCTLVQGYYFGRPQPVEEFSRLLATTRRH